MVKSKTVQLFSWNINGIRAVSKKGSLKEFFDKHDPDILCLQETKANEEQIKAEVEISERFAKHICYYASAEKKGYSGTAILSKDEPLNVEVDIPENIASKFELADKFGNANKEGRILVAEFPAFYVSTMYTPNVKNTLERMPLRMNWDKAALEYMQSLEKKKPVIFCGDLNVALNEIDLARPKQNVGKAGFTKEERQGLQDFVDAGYVDSFRHFSPDQLDAYTWWSARGGAREKNVGWRIDYWMSSPQLKEKLMGAEIHADIYGSDHCPISVKFAI